MKKIIIQKKIKNKKKQFKPTNKSLLLSSITVILVEPLIKIPIKINKI